MENNMIKEVIVVGGGASGMMAAGRAAELGKKVLLLEKGNCLGRKLNISGKGRCNFTNVGELEDFLLHFGKTRNFLRNAFHRFFNTELIEFFERSGLKPKVERGGRVFPLSDKADSVVRVLEKYILGNRVEVLLNSKVDEILVRKKSVYGIRIREKVFRAERIILATGGMSYPQTGSEGDGYLIAKSLGHTINPLSPALVPLLVKESFVKQLKGLGLKNVKIYFLKNDRELVSETGEMLFATFVVNEPVIGRKKTFPGITGPIVLSLSGDVVESFKDRRGIKLYIDFKPFIERKELEERIIRDLHVCGNKSIRNYLKDLLPLRFTDIFLEILNLSRDKRINQLRVDERKSIINLLKEFPLTITGCLPIEN
ncbi:MAG: aminoacetone oxidase family FAD-binding enzyme, partial [Candidatus Omnitrophica bacterium]|nr:aminoacetone oxidase family FAD-binding enzyme [Candidatus Omnitrophota bacterium]